MEKRRKLALITGGAGFILGRGNNGNVQLIRADVRSAPAVREAVQGVDLVFHFAAQVAVTTSILDPRLDFDINLAGTLNLLEALRALPEPPPLLFTSTNKIHGSLEDVTLESGSPRWQPADPQTLRQGIDETRLLDLHSPYGCSKGAADQYVLDYSRIFDLPGVVFRMSCIYGLHQFGTEDRGWVAHFLLQALKGQAITLYGDGRQVRDILAWRFAGTSRRVLTRPPDDWGGGAIRDWIGGRGGGVDLQPAAGAGPACGVPRGWRGRPRRAEAAALAGLRLVEKPGRLEWMDEPWDDVRETGRWLAELAGVFRGVVPTAAIRTVSGRGGKEPAVLTAGRLWDEAKNARLLEEAAPRLPWPVLAAGDADDPAGGRTGAARRRPLRGPGDAAARAAGARRAGRLARPGGHLRSAGPLRAVRAFRSGGRAGRLRPGAGGHPFAARDLGAGGCPANRPAG